MPCYNLIKQLTLENGQIKLVGAGSLAFIEKLNSTFDLFKTIETSGDKLSQNMYEHNSNVVKSVDIYAILKKIQPTQSILDDFISPKTNNKSADTLEYIESCIDGFFLWILSIFDITYWKNKLFFLFKVFIIALFICLLVLMCIKCNILSIFFGPVRRICSKKPKRELKANSKAQNNDFSHIEYCL